MPLGQQLPIVARMLDEQSAALCGQNPAQSAKRLEGVTGGQENAGMAFRILVPRPGVEPGHSVSAKQSKVQREKASSHLHNLSSLIDRASRVSPRFAANCGAICPNLAQISEAVDRGRRVGERVESVSSAEY